ncbi:MAG: alpha/beta hydrolase [Acetatifactor sp.]
MTGKARKLVIIMCFVFLVCACGKENNQSSEDLYTGASETAPSEDGQDAAQAEKQKTNDELYRFILDKLIKNEVSEIYQYASDDVKVISEEAFERMLLDLKVTFGEIVGIEEETSTVQKGISLYNVTLKYKNVDNHMVIYIQDGLLVGMNSDIRFRNSFDITYDNGVVETYFLLNSDGYELNAVYTHSSDMGAAVLLIPGSGVSDYNETVGLLTPFRDIALGLAEQGVGSLRIEKRTNRYRDESTGQISLQEEYFVDYDNALNWLVNNSAGDIYLLGHSLGTQIAPVLAEQNEVSGLILFHGSARHLADIIKDQYAEIDPDNSDYYAQITEYVKTITEESSRGLYFYNAPDYYWASYNELSTIETIKKVNLPTLIINSTADRQIFEEDVALWKDNLSEEQNISILVFDECSHFGYKIDTSNPAVLYSQQDFPEEILSAICSFIQQLTD